MGLGRYKTVPENEEGFYHCFVRCVRRAFLYGYDAVTNQDFSHRKTWIKIGCQARLAPIAFTFGIGDNLAQHSIPQSEEIIFAGVTTARQTRLCALGAH
jgi:hypothetical protein